MATTNYYSSVIAHTGRIIVTNDINVQDSTLTATVSGTGSAIKCANFYSNTSVFGIGSNVNIHGSITNGYAIESTSTNGSVSIGTGYGTFNVDATITNGGFILSGTSIYFNNLGASLNPPTLSAGYKYLNYTGTAGNRFYNAYNTRSTFLANEDVTVGYVAIDSTSHDTSFKSLTTTSSSLSSYIYANALTVTNGVSLANPNTNIATYASSTIGGNLTSTGSVAYSVYNSAHAISGYISVGNNLSMAGSAALTASNVTATNAISMTSGTLTSSSNITAGTNITVSAGTMNATSGTISAAYISNSSNVNVVNINAVNVALSSTTTANQLIGSYATSLNVTNNFSTGSALTYTGTSGTFTVGGNFTIGVGGNKPFTQTSGVLNVTGNQLFTNYSLSGGSNTIRTDASIGEFTFTGGSLSLSTDVDLVFSTFSLSIGSAKSINIGSNATLTSTGTAITMTDYWTKTGSGANVINFTSNSAKTFTGPSYQLTWTQSWITYPKIYIASTSGQTNTSGGFKDVEFSSAYTGALNMSGHISFWGNVKLTSGMASPTSSGSYDLFFGALSAYSTPAESTTITSAGKTWPAANNTYITTAAAYNTVYDYGVKLGDAMTVASNVNIGSLGGAHFDANGYTLTGTNIYITSPNTTGYRSIKSSVPGASFVATGSPGSFNLSSHAYPQFDKVDLTNVQIDLRNTGSTNATHSVVNSAFENYDANDGNIAWTTAGSSGSWVVPAGVTQISVLGVGGGGAGAGSANYYSGAGGGGGALHYRTVEVTPGETLYYIVGAGGTSSSTSGSSGGETTLYRASGVKLISALGGGGGVVYSTTGASGGTIGTSGVGGVTVGGIVGGGSGGNGGGGGSSYGAGGGGAGGYSGNGGNGYNSIGSTGWTAGSGGGGAGGNYDTSFGGSFVAGGVGIYGAGASGSGIGSNGSIDQGSASAYGAGGCGADNGAYYYSGANGVGGALRIVWNTSAKNRAFPSTNVSVNASIVATATKMGLTLRGGGGYSNVSVSRGVAGNIRFSTLLNVRTLPTAITFPTATIEVDDWQFNGSYFNNGVTTKPHVEAGSHVKVVGNSSANTILTKTGSGQGTFKYCGIRSITLSGAWMGGIATAADYSSVVTSDATKFGWYVGLASGTSYAMPTSWSNANNNIYLVGGGGGGGGSYYLNFTGRGGSGGGGGGWSHIKNYVWASGSKTYSIGSAGTAGGSGAAGGTGGNTVWDTTYVAGGGGGGQSNNNNAVAGGTGNGYNGGVGYNGGAGGTTTAVIGYASVMRGGGGGGAASMWGPGGAGSIPTVNSINTVAYGGAPGGYALNSSDATPYVAPYTLSGQNLDMFGTALTGGGGYGGYSSVVAGTAGSSFGAGGGGAYKPSNTSTTYAASAGYQGAILLTWNIPVDIVNTQFFLTL